MYIIKTKQLLTSRIFSEKAYKKGHSCSLRCPVEVFKGKQGNEAAGRGGRGDEPMKLL